MSLITTRTLILISKSTCQPLKIVLHFIYHKKCNVHRDAVISIADEKALQKGENFINLAEELYEQFLSELHDIADLLPEGESCDSDDKSDEEYTPVQTSSGRRVIPPNRLDLLTWNY